MNAKTTPIPLRWRVAPLAHSATARMARPRAWPSAHVTINGHEYPMVVLTCEDEYVPMWVKQASHAPITIFIAEWGHRKSDGVFTFHWRRLIKRADTLDDAKARAAAFIDRYRYYNPIVAEASGRAAPGADPARNSPQISA